MTKTVAVLAAVEVVAVFNSPVPMEASAISFCPRQLEQVISVAVIVPTTSSFCEGTVLPIPTLPALKYELVEPNKFTEILPEPS